MDIYLVPKLHLGTGMPPRCPTRFVINPLNLCETRTVGLCISMRCCCDREEMVKLLSWKILMVS
jgi:hypothetical protein